MLPSPPGSGPSSPLSGSPWPTSRARRRTSSLSTRRVAAAGPIPCRTYCWILSSSFAARPSLCSRPARKGGLDLPPFGKQSPYLLLSKALIHQVHGTAILRGTDDATGGLHHLLQARVEVGVGVARAKPVLHPALHLIVHGADLRQAQSCNEGSNQARPGQVDTFAEGSSQHRETDALALRGESLQETVAGTFRHAALLAPQRNLRAAPPKIAGDLLQIVEAAEESQIVAGPRRKLLGHQPGDGLYGGGPVAPARRDRAYYTHRELFGLERRLHVDPAAVGRQSQHVKIKLRRAQGCGK